MSVVILERPGFENRAALLSEHLSLPLLTEQDDLAVFSLALSYSDSGLSIQALDGSAGAVKVDFLSGANRHRLHYGGGKGQQLAKALGLDKKNFNPYIVDLTAGLGRDSFVMATLGARVSLIERHPVVYALLNDGLERARLASRDSVSLGPIIDRMSCICSEGEAFLAAMTSPDEQPDIIYLDPMFPPRNKSAKVKKEMQLFHQLVGFNNDMEPLLAIAIAKARYRVVVKRPAHAPELGDRVPSISFKGKSTRFDVYSIKRIPDER